MLVYADPRHPNHLCLRIWSSGTDGRMIWEAVLAPLQFTTQKHCCYFGAVLILWVMYRGCPNDASYASRALLLQKEISEASRLMVIVSVFNQLYALSQ